MFSTKLCFSKFKLLCVFTVVLFLLCGAFALGSEKPEEEALSEDAVHLGFVLPQLRNPFWVPVEYGARQAAKDLGVRLEYLGPAKFDPQQQIAMIESLIEKGVDGLIIICLTPGQMTPIINKAVDMGIPTVTTNNDAPDSKRIFFSGADLYNEGQVQAKTLKDYLEAHGIKKKVRVAITECVFGDFALQQRVNGFKDGISTVPNIEVIQEYDSGLDTAKNFSVIENVFAANPDLGAHYGTCAVDTRNGGEMVKRSGRDVIAFGHDLLPETLDLIKKGYTKWTLGQDPYNQGYFPVKALYVHIAEGKPLPQGFVRMNMEMVTTENVDYYIERESIYYTK